MIIHDLQSWVTPALLWMSAFLLILASWHDVAARILPDWYAAAIALSGLFLRAIDGNWMTGLGAAFAVFAVTAFCWRRGWLGGGDVKLLSACSLLVPPGDVLSLILATSLAGGALGIVYLLLGVAMRRNRSRGGQTWRPASLLARIARVECWRIRRRGPLPYGCAIAFAAIYVLFGPLTSWR